MYLNWLEVDPWHVELKEEFVAWGLVLHRDSDVNFYMELKDFRDEYENFKFAKI